MKKFLSFVFLLSCMSLNGSAYAEQVAPKLEYLMSIDLKLEPSVVIDKNMRITQVASGVVNGPNIKGTVQPPSADWVQVLPSGVVRLDVRLLVKTDEGEPIYKLQRGIQTQRRESSQTEKRRRDFT